MKTAQQRLAEIERQQIMLTKRLKAEEGRKTSKVGEYVRERMPDIEQSQAFLAWLSTDIDRTLFGVPVVKKERKPRTEKTAKPTHIPEKATAHVRPVEPAAAPAAPAKAAPELAPSATGKPGWQARVTSLTAPPQPPKMTGGAGDLLRAKMERPI